VEDVDDVLNPDVPSTVAQPLTSPPLTGTLDLTLVKGMRTTARRLLALPNGLHFRELTLGWLHEDDLQWINALAAACSHTLESLAVTHRSRDDRSLTIIDLSKATKLRGVVFTPVSLSIEWVTLALQTITPQHRDIRQIIIHMPYTRAFVSVGVDVKQTIGEAICGRWLELDHLLVKLWESHSIRTAIRYVAQKKEKNEMYESIGCLLPEMAERGMIELVEWGGYQQI